MKPFQFEIVGRRLTYTVDAYEPYPEAAFVVHRSLGSRGEWVVAHRGSTHVARRPDSNTRKAALELAKWLSDECPSAYSVRMGCGEDGEPDSSNLVGPVEEMRAEILTAWRAHG